MSFISGLKLCNLIHACIQVIRIHIAGKYQPDSCLPCLADQGAQLIPGNDAFIQDPKNLIQDKDVAFACHQDLLSKIQPVADADPCLILFFLCQLVKENRRLLKSENFKFR